MSDLSRRQFVLTGTAAAAVATLNGAPATFAQDSDKPTINVGSKNFTEHFLWGEMLALMLEDAGFPVERQFGLGGTAVLMEAVFNGDVDAFVELNGTGLVMLGEELPEAEPESVTGTPVSEARVQMATDIARQGYDEEFNLTWLDELGYDSAWAIGVRRETAEEHDLTTISDIEDLAGGMTLGTDQEYPVREDGHLGFVETYFDFGDMQSGDPGLMYQALVEGNVDAIVAYATDGRIPQLDIVLLEDDRNFFLPYFPAPVVRNEILENNPEIADILNKLGGQFTVEDSQQMNFAVDDGGETLTDVALPVLEEKGLIGSGED